MVSIHASSREDATFQIFSTAAIHGFNPRVLPRGRDSILPESFFTSMRFNPRVLPRGRDIFQAVYDIRKLFQSTRPPARTRPGLFAGYYGKSSFNPRVLAGGRDALWHRAYNLIWFQSTRPPARTRRVDKGAPQPDDVSIHASSREDATAESGCK